MKRTGSLAGRLPLDGLQMTQRWKDFVIFKFLFLLKKQVCWVAVPCGWITAGGRFEAPYRLHLQCLERANRLITLKMKSAQFFETSVSSYRSTWHNTHFAWFPKNHAVETSNYVSVLLRMYLLLNILSFPWIAFCWWMTDLLWKWNYKSLSNILGFRLHECITILRDKKNWHGV
jgi:hypothetical protein